MTELIWRGARELTRAIRTRELSCHDLMSACYDQIERLNPDVNAIVNLLPRESALHQATRKDEALARGDEIGVLNGLPMAVKDLQAVQGFPTTFGFVPYADQVADQDGELAARMRRAGAIIIGKTNVPEFGLGSNTFNSLFGATHNPYALHKTAGGSSGGAAAALATGMLPVADGSDMGGSLRNPASFCNVVGLRPSMGRVPDERGLGWSARLSVCGPMARTVADTAMLLAAQAGHYPPDPLSLAESGDGFVAPLERKAAGLKLAISPTLGGLPVDREVEQCITVAGETFTELGATVEEACPDLTGAMDVFQVQRAANLAVLGRELETRLPNWREHTKDAAIWNIEKGLALTAQELIQADLERTKIYRRVVRFFHNYDALLCPAAQVPPFDIEDEWVREINDQTLTTYIDWMTVCCAISVTALPAISVPGGFTSAGLPVGLQIVGRPRGDFELLQIGYLFEQATKHYQTKPAIV